MLFHNLDIFLMYLNLSSPWLFTGSRQADYQVDREDPHTLRSGLSQEHWAQGCSSQSEDELFGELPLHARRRRLTRLQAQPTIGQGSGETFFQEKGINLASCTRLYA